MQPSLPSRDTRYLRSMNMQTVRFDAHPSERIAWQRPCIVASTVPISVSFNQSIPTLYCASAPLRLFFFLIAFPPPSPSLVLLCNYPLFHGLPSAAIFTIDFNSITIPPVLLR